MCSSLRPQITFEHATCKLTAMNYSNLQSAKKAKQPSEEFKNKVLKNNKNYNYYTQTILVCLQKQALILATLTTVATYKTRWCTFLLFIFHLLCFHNRQIEKYNFPVELLNSDKRRQELSAPPNAHMQRRDKARQCNWQMRLQRQCHGC